MIICHAVFLRPSARGLVAVTNPQLQMHDVYRALDIKINELRQDFGGSDDVPAQLLHSLAGMWNPDLPGIQWLLYSRCLRA